MPSLSHDGSTGRLKKPNKDRILSIDKNYLKKYKTIKSISCLKEFTQCSTIHGVQHIFRERETLLHRLIWIMFFSSCLSGAIYVMNNSWTGYYTVPIQVTVSDTNYPLDGIHFPAVAVCPVKKIVYAQAIKYLTEMAGNWVRSEPKVKSFLEAVSALQHPLYHNMLSHLEDSREILPRLGDINVTDLMINSLAPCHELFVSCFWQGFAQNCCAVFNLQRSEEGFCYSFNSFTSEQNRHCIYRDANLEGNCTLKSTGNTGPRSGLEILLKEMHEVTVNVHHPNQFPEPGMGSVIPIGDLDKMNIGIKPTITESTDAVRALSDKVIGCYFKDSKKTSITKIYSQNTCLLECRMKLLKNDCKCLPYYITMDWNTLPCSATQLDCIVEHRDELRFFRPPSDSTKVSEEVKRNSLDCTHCLPTCNDLEYDITIDHTKDTTARKRDYYGYVDVFYRSAGAVKYTRDMAYDYVQLLVNLGGIIGLFLGGSLLSLLEAVYWISKAILTFILPVSKKKIHTRKQEPTKTVFTTNQAWLN